MPAALVPVFIPALAVPVPVTPVPPVAIPVPIPVLAVSVIIHRRCREAVPVVCHGSGRSDVNTEWLVRLSAGCLLRMCVAAVGLCLLLFCMFSLSTLLQTTHNNTSQTGWAPQHVLVVCVRQAGAHLTLQSDTLRASASPPRRASRKLNPIVLLLRLTTCWQHLLHLFSAGLTARHAACDVPDAQPRRLQPDGS